MLALAECLVIFVGAVAQVSAEPHPVWDPKLEQAVVGSFGQGTPPASIESLAELVRPYLRMNDLQLADRIATVAGGGRGEDAVRERAAATYNLALLYRLTRVRHYGHRSAVLLLAYANKFPSWQYSVCRGKCGVWTRWYHADFDVSKNLALAFDLLWPDGIFDDFGTEARTRVRNLLVEIVRADLRFPLSTMNWAFFRPLGLVIYGRVLDDPELVHLGYWFLAKLLHDAYTRDGFLAEGTYSYNAQMTRPLLRPIQAFYLDGYSDPPGYIHVPFERRWDSARIDSYSLSRRHGAALQRMANVLRMTALPNGDWPILNETKYHGKAIARPPPDSLLLGGLGHAILARGAGKEQTQARLDFSPTVSHCHRDALNLIYFGAGTEVIGGTAYRRPDRAWNRSTVSQNLVVVDRSEQKGDYFVDRTMSPYVPGSPSRRSDTQGGSVFRVISRQRWDASRENTHNNVTMWIPGTKAFDSVQVVEADGRDAYGNRVDRYLRTLIMVGTQGSNAYLVDIFRVRGGTEYHWLLHGGHEWNDLSINPPLKPVRDRLGRIEISKQATVDEGWSARFEYANDTHLRVFMVGAPGTAIGLGAGPRFEIGGLQPYLVARRQARGDQEQVFLAVHEAYRGSPSVVAVEPIPFQSDVGSAVGLRVLLADGSVDYVMQALAEGAHRALDRRTGVDLETDGRIAHVRTRGDKVEWMYLAQGGHLRFGTQSLVTEARANQLRGLVTSVERREAGQKYNAFLVDHAIDNGIAFAGRSLYVMMSNGWRWAYRIEAIRGNRIIVSEEPGFELDGKRVDMQYFPLQEYLGMGYIPGPVRFEIARVAALVTPQDETDEAQGSAPPTG